MPGQQLKITYPSEETVVKSNRLVKAKTPFSKLEHRVVAALIAQLEKGQRAFEEQTVRLKKIKDLSRSSSPDFYSRATQICDSLASKSIGIQKELDDGSREYQAIPVFEICRYIEKRGVIKAQFNDRMGQHLLELRNRFTMYWLPFFAQLPSRHTMRIYELLKMREGLGELIVSIEELREILGIVNKYDRFSKVKYHLITPAQKQIEEHTDILFTYEVLRKGRTPKRLRFFIQNDLPETSEAPSDIPQPARHKSFDYDEKTETEEVRLDPEKMFKADLNQDDLNQIEQEEVEELRRKAQSTIPDTGGSTQSWVAAETLRRMKMIYAERESSS
jgi:plasmid replication initiation protein